MTAGSSKLQQEIKQSRPFGSPEQEAALGLLRTADHIRRKTAELLAPTGLSVEQYNVLRILRGSGPAGLPTLEVADRMIERSPAITRLLDKLEQKKLVQRKRCKADRRRVLCSITARGMAVLSELDEPLSRATHDALAVLSATELDTLIGLMDRIRGS